MDLRLTGKRVVVTGASKGIGRAIATALLREGARLAICARNEDGLKTAQSQLAALGEVHASTCDLASAEQTSTFVNWASERLGGLDILVSNVSAGGTDFRANVEVDIIGAQTLMRGALEHMQDHSGANIVCISSRAASIGIPFLQSYAAVKAATISMVKSLALEVAERGIRVNAVSPGDIEFEGGAWARVKKERPEFYASILNDNPLGRLGTLEEVANVVTFITSEKASFVTGANILVDGAATKSLQI
jgi:NAD(P)-dependent dehydrogenase (short-subunit alcohol dehydrogenase family)